MLKYLKDIFSTVPTLIISITITLNILIYIQVSLKLFLPSQIYKLSLDQPNHKYIVCLTRKLGFQDLAFFIPKDSFVSEIPKIIVFANKIKDAIKLEKYLQSKLVDCIYNKNRVFIVISLITFNLDTNIKTRIMENL